MVVVDRKPIPHRDWAISRGVEFVQEFEPQFEPHDLFLTPRSLVISALLVCRSQQDFK